MVYETVNALVVGPVRVTVKLPGSSPCSAAFASVAVIVTVGKPTGVGVTEALLFVAFGSAGLEAVIVAVLV
jgi:hypothetical protein